MSDILEEFVLGTLDTWGSRRDELTPGVWRISLPDGDEGFASWYLGPPEGMIVSFDLDRWEEGSRLECLTVGSPLVRRLGQYAEGRGCIATVTIRKSNALYEPFLLCRFHARYKSDTHVEERVWLGMSLARGIAVKVAGDPLLGDDVYEGPPDESDQMPSETTELEALVALTAQWEEQVLTRAREFAAEAEEKYESEADEAASILKGRELEDRLRMLVSLYAPTVETALEAAVRLWRPGRKT